MVPVSLITEQAGRNTGTISSQPQAEGHFSGRWGSSSGARTPDTCCHRLVVGPTKDPSGSLHPALPTHSTSLLFIPSSLIPHSTLSSYPPPYTLLPSPHILLPFPPPCSLPPIPPILFPPPSSLSRISHILYIGFLTGCQGPER